METLNKTTTIMCLSQWFLCFYIANFWQYKPYQSVSSIQIQGTCYDNTTAMDLPVRIVAVFNQTRKELGNSTKTYLSKTAGTQYAFDVQFPDSINYLSFESEGYRNVLVPVNIIGKIETKSSFRFHLAMTKKDSLSNPPINYLALCFTKPNIGINYEITGTLPHNVPFRLSIGSGRRDHITDFTYERMLSGEFLITAISTNGKPMMNEKMVIKQGLNFKVVHVNSFDMTKMDSTLKPLNKSVNVLLSSKIIYFKQSEYELSKEAKMTLDSVAQILLSRQNIVVNITGYTDNVGDRAKNMTLSEYRARVVENYLRHQGIRTDRFSVLWKGPDSPITLNDLQENKANNRRVVVEFTQE